MFFEAQERYRRGDLFGRNFKEGYARDLLRNYGNGGRRFDLPQVSRETYERGLQFRDQEKRHYNELQQQLQNLSMQLSHERQLNNDYARFINTLEFLDDPVDAPHPGDRGGDTGGDSGRGALPPADRPGQDDTDAREPEAIISSPPTNHEPPNASSARSRRNRSQQQLEDRDDARIAELPAAEAGGAHTDPADGTDADVGGPAAEHDPAE